MPAFLAIIPWLLGFIFAEQFMTRYGGVLDKAAGVIGFQPPAPGQSGQQVVGQSPKPSGAQAISDLANNPFSVWGFAALGCVAVFLIAQLRAAGHEAGQGIMDTTDALSNPEDVITTRRRGSAYQARKAKRGKAA